MQLKMAGLISQAFAIAASSDLEGRKSRIRRSKEERKSLAESFIKKYQKSNNGNFPSLNITHKEVGGSFYTAREIFREIIQENRVLTSPKMNLEVCDRYQLLDNGSMATKPQNNLLASDINHLVVNKSPYQHGIKSEESFSSSSMQFYGPESLDLKIISGLSKIRNVEGYDTDNHFLLDLHQDLNAEDISNLGEQLPPPNTLEFETEILVGVGEVIEENPVSGKAIFTKAVLIHDQDKSEGNTLTPVQNFDGVESGRLNEKKYFNKNNQTVEKTKEFEQRVCPKSVVMEMLGGKKAGAEEMKVLCATTSHVNSDVMVESFPSRPLSDSKLMFTGCPSGVDENKLPDSTLELDDELSYEKMVRNLQNPCVECSSLSTPFESTELDVGDVKDLEYEVNSATKHVLSEESVTMERNSNAYVTNGMSKGIRPPLLQRISLETWKRESKKTSLAESNPLLRLVKFYMVAFVKFWSE